MCGYDGGSRWSLLEFVGCVWSSVVDGRYYRFLVSAGLALLGQLLFLFKDHFLTAGGGCCGPNLARALLVVALGGLHCIICSC